jgi:DNA adenine methylase
MNALLKYPGAKWSIASWITDTFPDHHSYLEPYFGSGAVFFHKEPSNIETINDKDGNVINLFKWIKNDPEKLAHEIYWTPYAREIYNATYEVTAQDSLDKAVNFYIRCNMGYGFRTNGERVGWKNDVQGRERAYAAVDWANIPEKIIQAGERLRAVQIECTDAVKLIERFNNSKVLIYCDPPYLLGTRCRKQYRCEMTDADHIALLEALLRHKGYAAISGYPSQIYDDMLKGWHRIERTSLTQSMKKKTEVLWTNYEPRVKQLTFFDL